MSLITILKTILNANLNKMHFDLFIAHKSENIK